VRARVLKKRSVSKGEVGGSSTVGLDLAPRSRDQPYVVSDRSSSERVPSWRLAKSSCQKFIPFPDHVTARSGSARIGSCLMEGPSSALTPRYSVAKSRSEISRMRMYSKTVRVRSLPCVGAHCVNPQKKKTAIVVVIITSEGRADIAQFMCSAFIITMPAAPASDPRQPRPSALKRRWRGYSIMFASSSQEPFPSPGSRAYRGATCYPRA